MNDTDKQEKKCARSQRYKHFSCSLFSLAHSVSVCAEKSFILTIKLRELNEMLCLPDSMRIVLLCRMFASRQLDNNVNVNN